MAFERFKREQEAEAERKAALAEQARLIREAELDALSLAEKVALKLAKERQEKTLALANDSGIRSKLDEFKGLLARRSVSSSVLSHYYPPYGDISQNPSRDGYRVIIVNPEEKFFNVQDVTHTVSIPRQDPESIIDVLGWRTRPKEHNYDDEYDHCLVAETCPDGTIVIHGEMRDPIPEIKPGLFRRGHPAVEGINGTTTLPESIWRNNPGVLEEAIVKAYQAPISLGTIRRYVEPGE